MFVRRLATLLLLGATATAGCIEEPVVTMPSDTNAKWMRSITVDASKCLRKDGSYQPCADIDVRDMQRVRHMSGVIGAPLRAIDADSDTKAQQGFRALTALWARIPVGYGCGATLQGVFPDKTKDVKNLANYDFTRLSEIIGAVREQRAVPLWTAAYGLGDGGCAYGDHGLEQDGKPIGEQTGAPVATNDAESLNWAKAVLRVIEYYDLELPELKKGDSACSPPAGTEKPWFCSPSMFNIEFGLDPNGAGGYTKQTKETWLKSYKHLATEIRGKFPYPANTIFLFGPSVVIRGKADIENTTGEGRSWLYDFIDYVAVEKLPLSFLTFEVVATTPVEAADIAKAVRTYVDQKGLQNEEKQPLPLFVTDLRIQESKLPTSLTDDRARLSAYRGAFYAATKVLWQGLVFGATIGRTVRFPSQDPALATAEQIATTAVDSDLMWFKVSPPDPGSLKPAAWQSFWFYDGFLGGGGGSLDAACSKADGCPDLAAQAQAKSMVLVAHGPDALGVSGTQKSDPVKGMVVVSTRENCVSYDADSLGEARDCVTGADAERFPAVAQGRKRVVRVFIADMNVTQDAKETLKHDIRVQISGLPQDVKSVGYRWARMDGSDTTWTAHNFPDQGVLDVENGAFYLRRTIAVPSMQYFEFLY